MKSSTILIIIILYFLVLIAISFLTSRKSEDSTFFSGDRKSPWYIVAFGMIGASLSGVTFLSVPGMVGNNGFSYFQTALGYTAGYFVIAYLLMPLYYKHNLVSIYTFLGDRIGNSSHKTGSVFFLISRVIGASFRLFLVASVLDLILFGEKGFGIPYWATVLITIALIYLYTFKGGISTVVWTDSLQTFFMLSAAGLSIYFIGSELDLSTSQVFHKLSERGYSNTFHWEWSNQNFFIQFISGMFITIVMTGLDQDMMQKNLTCKNIGEARKNMIVFSIVLVFVNLAFLCLGGLLHIYYTDLGLALPEKPDEIFTRLAINHFGGIIAVVFLLGVIAAAYSSADSALTSLTTAFMVDFVPEEKHSKTKRSITHLGFAGLIFLVVLVMKAIGDEQESLIVNLFKVAGYTYGPLLGMFSYAIFTNRKPFKEKLVPIVCVSSIAISYMLNSYSAQLFGGYQIGFEILLINGAITFLGMLLLGRKNQ